MSGIDIYQIYYAHDQISSLEIQFLPFNNEGKIYPYNFEYAVFFELYKKQNWQKSNLLGSVSWKFKTKTGRSGSEFLDHIRANPGYDVYFVNPFPALTIYKNVWAQGAGHHHNILQLTSKIFQQVGYDPSILIKETPPYLTAYCNYWVANKEFWDSYIAFISPIWSYLTENDNELTQSLNLIADSQIRASYLPFIFERLFSTFLVEKKWKVSSLTAAPQNTKIGVFEKMILSNILRASECKSHAEIKAVDLFLIKLNAYLKSRF